MTNQMRPGTDHTRVPSAAAMRARDASRDPEAEALGLRGDLLPPEASAEDLAVEPATDEQDEPQPPADRSDS